MRNLPYQRPFLAAFVTAMLVSVAGYALAQTPPAPKFPEPPPAPGAALQLAQPAEIRLLLPVGADNATLTFDTHSTTQKGTDRVFITPLLAPGEKYSYVVTATWMALGKEVKETRKIAVRAGQQLTIDFTMPERAQAAQPPKASPAKSRSFLFTYAATFMQLPKGKTVKIWLPLPPTTPDQDVAIDMETLPGKATVHVEPLYGNKILFMEAMPDKDGKITASLTYKVTRREVRPDSGALHKPAATENLARFLQADKLVPLDGKPLELIKGEKLGPTQLETAKTLYTTVNRHMKYSKEGIGWGNGDAVWACDSKFGNCSDFHSLFIALARSQKIPAKFEMGFPIPQARGEGPVGGYHCWAWFLPDSKNWLPVDISEANRNPEQRDYFFCSLCENRVVFTTGRDIDLVPRQAGPPLNFFIYPYAEVDGQAVPQEQIQRVFSYKDVVPAAN